ncbi:DUF7471 family protein [Natronolimnohabitans innermongolicus]|uniref:Uncharacterized protein n=1 Tax=Natronolimnohabitans innermongolicus JCM 12255 TaxID=1227499 RepID=L9WQD7_9EURY|nr:hypothetical protein [Natronolimnohabitans innermongolicus]ELY51699.1 hypothetical protein C493_17256 [Natronolimnohabitans innermongolicus JCM 12255]
MDHTSPFEVQWLDPQLAPVLLAVIVLAVLGTTILFGCGIVAYSRRRSTRYLLVTAVLGLLVTRSIVGLGTVFGLVPMTIHHLVEHSVDFSIAVLILYAVYRSGPGISTDPESRSRSRSGSGSGSGSGSESDPTQAALGPDDD